MSRNLLTDQPKLRAIQINKQLSSFFIFGIFLGVISKYSDTVPANGGIGLFFNLISNITTRLGIWVLFATLIAVWSKNPKFAAIKVFGFFVGLLIAYYIYSQMLFGFFPTYYFIRWGAIAIVSPLAAYIVWFSRKEGWLAAICAALPIGLLLALGFPSFYGFSLVLGFDIFAAIVLLILLPRPTKQYLMVLPFSILTVFLIRNLNILSYLFGGL